MPEHGRGGQIKAVNREEWKLLLRLMLAQRLEINALQSALKSAGILSDRQIKEIRIQTLHTAEAWSSQDNDDVLNLIRIHGSAAATMLVPPVSEG